MSTDRDAGAMDATAVVQGVTYWAQDAPIINAECTSCHAAGGLGPMPLTTYREVRPFDRLIAEKTAMHQMPPWPPAMEYCRPLAHPNVLTDAQIATLADWSRARSPEGDPATYVAPSPANRAQTLPPDGDLAVRMNGDYIAPSGVTDDYRCFVVDPGLTTERDVVGVRVRPGNAQLVHHVLLYEVRASALGALQHADDNDPGEGYRCVADVGFPARLPATGSDEFDTQMVAAWAPVESPGTFPRALEYDSRLDRAWSCRCTTS